MRAIGGLRWPPRPTPLHLVGKPPKHFCLRPEFRRLVARCEAANDFRLATRRNGSVAGKRRQAVFMPEILRPGLELYRPIACAREKREGDQRPVSLLDFRRRRDGFDHRPNLIDRWAGLVSARGGDSRQIVGRIEILGVREFDARAIARLLSEPREKGFQCRERGMNGRGRQGLAGSRVARRSQIRLERPRQFDMKFLCDLQSQRAEVPSIWNPARFFAYVKRGRRLSRCPQRPN